MQVREVMTPDVECVHPDDSLQTAAARMKELDVGPLPVVENGKVVGMLTDRDITVRATAAGIDPRTARVRDVMTPEVIFCCYDQDVSEVARLMKERQVRRVVVVDQDRKLGGIVSLGDLAVHTGDEQLAGRTLEAVSEPAHPRL